MIFLNLLKHVPFLDRNFDGNPDQNFWILKINKDSCLTDLLLSILDNVLSNRYHRSKNYK